MYSLKVLCLLIFASGVYAQDLSFIDPERLQLEMQQFELTEEQVIRVQSLRMLDSPYGVDNLSALELLGKYAETDAEREEFARKHVIAMADNIGRSQAWSLAIYKAARSEEFVSQILAANPIISQELSLLGMSPPNQDSSASTAAERYAKKPAPGRTLMVALDCESECIEAFSLAQNDVLSGRVESLDVVFVDSTEEDQTKIFNWARARGISRAELISGKFNLHTDSDEWIAVRNGLSKVPRLIR